MFKRLEYDRNGNLTPPLWRLIRRLRAIEQRLTYVESELRATRTDFWTPSAAGRESGDAATGGTS